MQSCKNCGKEIKYIATGKNINIICDGEEITVYTFLGRKVQGYKVHKCEGENDGKIRKINTK